MNALRVRLSAVMTNQSDSEYVMVTRNMVTRSARHPRVRVGTYDNPHGDNPHVIFYVPMYHRWKVNSSVTVERIMFDNKDPLVNRLLNEHCAASPDGDLVEYTQDDFGEAE
jgi:predicted homoserine dehydrogenase-like protein